MAKIYEFTGRWRAEDDDYVPLDPNDPLDGATILKDHKEFRSELQPDGTYEDVFIRDLPPQIT